MLPDRSACGLALVPSSASSPLTLWGRIRSVMPRRSRAFGDWYYWLFLFGGFGKLKVGGFGSLPLASNSNHGRGALAPASVGGGLAALGRLNRLPPRPSAAPFGPSTPYRPAVPGGALSRPSALRSAPLRSCSIPVLFVSKIFSIRFLNL